MGQKQKTEKEREKERAKVGDNNGQATHGARKPPGPKCKAETEGRRQSSKIKKEDEDGRQRWKYSRDCGWPRRP